MSERILKVALPTPIRSLFDYLDQPDGSHSATVGARVEVPFGHRKRIGTVVDISDHSALEKCRLKPIIKVIDPEPLLPQKLFELLLWSASYYHHPIGEVISSALPKALREGKPASLTPLMQWVIVESKPPLLLKNAPKQVKILELLSNAPSGLTTSEIAFSISNPLDALKRLQLKGVITEAEINLPHIAYQPPQQPDYALNPEQISAIEAITPKLNGFFTALIDGITGSGKTEIYMQIIDRVLQQNRQILILVPEIGLTPQLVQRFTRRFKTTIVLLHSGLADGERFKNWMLAKEGSASIIIGTRSAVFTPFSNLGLIIVDEEHDSSFKQHEGFRYSARDIAVKRAQLEHVPILLGSATPSLESLYHAIQQNYQHICLTQRVGSAQTPDIELLDTRISHCENGLAQSLIKRIQRQLDSGNQVLIFLNRRGYAPVLLCYQCHWTAHCKQCDAKLTYYQRHNRLRCHHCGSEYPVPVVCPDCGKPEIHPVGEGTERLETSLAQLFPHNTVIRIDRDTTRNRYAFNDLLEKIEHGKGQILIGTQLIAKGHHFPNVTLVVVVNADSGLFSVDFRSSEHMAQQIMQVSGRAGREDKRGHVVIQTAVPEHPLWKHIQSNNYNAFATMQLEERKEIQFPPFCHLALIRAEARSKEETHAFLVLLQNLALPILGSHVQLYGPVASPMERRAGRYRAQLIIQSAHRVALHLFIRQWLPEVEQLKQARKVRWSIDIDPIEMY